MGWLGDALSTLGKGVASLLSWLLSGVLSILAKIISAAGGTFDLLDAVFSFFGAIKDTIVELIPTVFPWIPPEVLTVISLGLIAVLLGGIVKKVMGK